MTLLETVTAAFNSRFGGEPAAVARAPGRVNIIGEHTDYNDGFVFPMAIDKAIWIALRPRSDDQIVLHSLDMDETATFDWREPDRGAGGWIRYVQGLAWALAHNGYELSGWQGVMAGDVPIGSGLSSSAALEMAVARTFAAASPFDWQPTRMAEICRQADHEWVGIQSGIMDQLISAEAQAGYALLIDCRSLALEPVPLPAGVAIVVMDTRTPRALISSAYNQRWAECREAARALEVDSLRDVTWKTFERASSRLDPTIRRRARHVISENERTLQAAEAMRSGDTYLLGALMDNSHDSLRDDYEVSSETLEAMVGAARRQPGCLGARMTGAGFGGCAIALVPEPLVEEFISAVSSAYTLATGLKPTLFAAAPAGGAQLILP